MGLDVHAETIAVAIAEPNGEARSLRIIPNREESIRKLPTDHDYAARPANIRLINRRQSDLDRYPL